MPKSTSGRSKNGSDVSSRSERKRTEDEQSTEAGSRDESSATSSSRRKSSRRDDDAAENEGFMPNSTSFSSSSRAPYAGVAAPSVASSYATAFTKEPEPHSRPPQLVRNESMTDPPKRESKESSRASKSGSKSDRSRAYNDSDDDSRNVGRPDSERNSRRESRKSSIKNSSRALDDHDAALPHNQFPGAEPLQYTQPYRPPGQAAVYYGDHGESVQFQPGVRPNPPSVIHTADQAHLMEPTTEAKPPPEPSSLGQVGASASFYAMDGSADDTAQQSTPSKPGRNPSSRPSKSSRYDDQRPSSRGSPGPSGRMSGPSTASVIGATAMGAGIGQAAEYYSGSIPLTNPGQVDSSYQAGPPPRTESPESYAQSSRPPKGAGSGSQSGSHHHGSAAATGLAGAAAASYLAGHAGSHHGHSSQYPTGPGSGFVLGQNQSAFPGMQQQRRQRRRGPLGKLVNWFRDPEGVAEFEAYTEAIGVCKYCFDPNSSPADAPRKHHYHHHRRSSGSRHGSSARVDKTYRYSSSDDDKRRSSTAKKFAAGGLAAYGATKLGEAAFKQKYDFDDTYSVKSGRPTNRSRVSFKEEDQYSTRVERRDSRRKSRRDDERYEKRSSRRRDSSSSSSAHGTSRGNVLGVATGAAGLAMGAEALHRRRSRSRSRSPSKRKYYSKRVSPRHSYVDLSATSSGAAGLTGFFSPSSNNKKGKKQKGLFNFTNASSSSSDADLAFGEGTVKRKPSKKGKGKENDANYGSTAAILGLAATGAALAAESDRRNSKGKNRRYTDEVRGRDPRRSNSGSIKLQDHETTTDGENDDVWEDASDVSSSSIDAALAYGGRASASQSRESLQGTDKWDWRWGPNKEKRREKLRRQSSGNFDTAAAGLAGAGIGAIASGIMSTDSTPKPPMQHLDPVPTSDPTLFDARQYSMVSGISPGTSVPPPEVVATSGSVPLQQPQPIFPVAAVPDKFGRMESAGRYSDRPEIMDDSRVNPRELDREGRARRDSSPAKLPARESRGTVSFNIPDATPEDEQLQLEKDQQRHSRREDKERRKSADSAVFSAADKDVSQQRRRSSEYERREAEIEAELQRLYEEDRRRKQDRQRKQDDRNRKVEVAGVAAAAAAVGAGIAAGVASKAERRDSSTEDTTPRRKSIMKKGKERDVSPQGENQQERIARMAAQRVRSTPSPVHENYSTFFVPTEIAEHVKEHDVESAHRDGPDPHVVEIVPGSKKKETFDPFNYRPFGIDPDDDPTEHPWPVPMLDLVEPTPPASRTHSDRGTPSPMIEPIKEVEEEEDFGEQLERKGSRVTWGDDDINIYEAMTPEWERSDFIPDSPEQIRKQSCEVPPSEAKRNGRPRSESPPRPTVNRVYTIEDDDMTFASSAEKASEDFPGAFPSADERGSPLPQVDNPPAEGARSGTPTMDNLDDILRESPFHPQASSETVDDLADLNRPEPQTGPGFVEDEKLPATPKGDLPRSSDIAARGAETTSATEEAPSSPRLSKSDRRRMERAASLEDNIESTTLPRPQEDRAVPFEEPESSHAFDYLVDEDGKSLPPASALGVAATTVLSDGRRSSTDAARDTLASSIKASSDEVEDFSKPKRSFTFDDATRDETRSRSKADYASDPEDWERSDLKKRKDRKRSSKNEAGSGSKAALIGAATGAAVAAATAAAEDDFYSSEKPQRRKSKTESEIFDDDDVQSVTSSPATIEELDQKSRRKPKRDSEVYDDDDDARSVASSPADTRKKSEEKVKDKKSSSGIWSSIFGGPKSDLSTSSKKSSRSAKSEGRVERDRPQDSEKRQRRRSKGVGFDDVTSATSETTRKSRHDAALLTEQGQTVMDSRDQSVDDGFVSADEAAASKADKNGAEEPSFLAERPEMPHPTDMHIPMATDGVSGQHSEGGPSDKPLNIPILPPPLVSGDAVAREAAPSREKSQFAVDDSVSPESKRMSGLKTADLPSSPAVGTSPTAMPFSSRRFPVSPATPRASWSSPMASPSSPLTTPRTRQGRPKSTEFRSGREFRPLYLVQKSIGERTPTTATPEVEENLPSLPSSRTSSAHPSMENLRGEAERQDYFDIHQMTPEKFRERGRRHSYSYWHDASKRRISPDYLDSRSATPVPADVQLARDMRGGREKPKYEFHSPSELLQDPAMNPDMAEGHHEVPRPSSPLPSVVSTEQDDFMSAQSGSPSSRGDSTEFERQRSRARSRSESSAKGDTSFATGLGLVGGSALGLATSHTLSKDEGKLEETRDVPESADMYGADTIPFALAPPPPPLPPPPPAPGPATFTTKSSKRSVTEPAASETRETKPKSEPSKGGGMGSIAAMVAARANQIKKDRARKSLPVELPSAVATKDGVSPAEIGQVTANELTREPDSEPYDEIASAEALIAASRALRGADSQEPGKQITVPEPPARGIVDPAIQTALDTSAQDIGQFEVASAFEPSEDKFKADPIARKVIEPIAETTVENAAEEPEEWAFTTNKSKKDKRKTKSTSPTDLPPSQETTEPPTPAEEADEWATTSGKTSKKDKKKGKRQEPLAPLDISKAEARDETGERTVVLDDDQPLTAISSEKRSDIGLPEPQHAHEPEVVPDEVLPQAEAVQEALQSRKVSIDEQPAEAGDLSKLEHHDFQMDPSDYLNTERTFDPATGLSEHGSRMSFPWDDNEAAPAPMPEHADRELSFEDLGQKDVVSKDPTATFIPSAQLLNKPSNNLGAFEEAFERALRARGLPMGKSRHDALDGFLSKRKNAPFIAKGGLTPIAGSEASSPADKSPPPEDEKGSHRHALTKQPKKDKKRSRKLERKGSSLRQMSLSEDEGEHELTTHAVQDLTGSPSTLTRDVSLAEVEAALVTAAEPGRDGPNPFGTDFEVRSEELEPHGAPAEVRAILAAEAASEVPSHLDTEALSRALESEPPVEELAEEFSWAPVSKKDKKKKKKSQTSTPGEIGTPAEKMPLETPSEPIETPQEQVNDDWAPTTAKKAKKSKKDKKRQRFDWSEDSAPVAGVAAAIAAGAAIGASAFDGEQKREVVAESEELPAVPAAEATPLEQERELDQPITEPGFTSVTSKSQTEHPREADVDNFATITSKKDKKKKKRSKSTAFDWDDVATETTTPSEGIPTSAADDAVPSTVKAAGDAFTSNLSETRDQLAPGSQATVVDTPAETMTEAGDDEWVETSNKQSKKAKQKAKKAERFSLTDMDDDESKPEMPVETEQEKGVEALDTSSTGQYPVAGTESINDMAQLTAITSASARDHHNAEQHQNFLADALSKVSSFPARPSEESLSPADESRGLPAADVLPPIGSTMTDSSTRQEDTATYPVAAEDTERVLDVEPTEPTLAQTLPEAGPTDVSAMLSEPVEPETAVEEDIWSLPSKKSKKDKKKAKKKSLAFEDFDTPTIEPADQAARTEDVPMSDAIPLIEPTSVVEDSVKQSVAENVAKEREEILEPAEEPKPLTDEPQTVPEETSVETPAQEEDESVWTSGKKSKKDEKKARKRASVLANESEPASPAAEGDTPAEPSASTERDLGVGVAAGTLGGAAATAEAMDIASGPPAETPLKGMEDDFAWQPSTKKNKKDKKKRKSLAWADEEASTPATQDSGLVPVEEIDTTPASEVVIPKATTEISTTDFVHETEPIAIEGAGDSKRESQAVAAEMLLAAQATEDAVEVLEAEKVPEVAPQDVVLPTEVEEPALTAGMTEADEGTIELEERAPATEPTPTEEPEEFSWAPTNKSKKDKKKKKKRGTAFDFDSPTEGTSTPEPEPFAKDIVVDEPATVEPVAAEDDWGFSTAKKSKKDKKKRESTLTLDEPIEQPAIPEPKSEPVRVDEITQSTMAVEPAHMEEITDAKDAIEPLSTEAVAEDQDVEPEMTERGVSMDQAVPTPPEREPEEDWGFSTKKSKKDKKKKRSSQLAAEEPSEPVTPEPEAERIAELQPTARSVSMEEVATAPVPVAEPEEDWGFATKKSKKDKKKKRASAFTLDETEEASTPGTESPAAELDIEAPSQAEPEPTAGGIPLEESTTAPVAGPEQWGFSTRKNKKDKKKKRGSALAWDDATPAESDVPAETRDVEMVQGPEIVQPVVQSEPAIQVVEEPLHAESERLPESIETITEVEPTREIPEYPAVPAVQSEGIEPISISEPIEIKSEPEPESWTFTTNKSKKDKKKRKSVPGVFGEEAESGTATPATPMEVGVPASSTAILEEPRIPEASLEVDLHAGEEASLPHDSSTTRDLSMADEAVSTSMRDAPVEVTPKDEWGFATKKSKKDKKKKRQSTFQEVSAAEDSSIAPTPAELADDEPIVDLPPTESHCELEPEQPKHDSEETTEADAPIDWANDPWGVSTKKSKKDKKKKKQSTIEGTNKEVPVEPEASRDIDFPRPEPPSAQEKAAGLVTMAFEDDRRERSRSRSRSREAPAVPVEVPTDLQATEPYTPAEPEISQNAMPAEAGEEDWNFSTAKPKRDKKKKRESMLDDTSPETRRKGMSAAETASATAMEAFSMSEGKDVTAVDYPLAEETTSRVARPPTDLPMPDIETADIEATTSRDLPSPVHVKEIDEYEFGRASPTSQRASVAEPELAPNETLREDAVEGPVQPQAEAPPTPAERDDWYAPVSKSKKDKKKKKKQSGFEDVVMEGESSTGVSARATEENIVPVSLEEKGAFEEVAAEDEWTVGKKKSKKDKKKMKSQWQWEEGDFTPRSPGAIEEPQTREMPREPKDYPEMRERSSSLKASVLPIAETMEPVQMSESSPTEERIVPGAFDAVPPVVPEPPSAIPETTELERGTFADTAEATEAQEDDWYSTPKKKPKKDKKVKSTSTKEYQEAPVPAEASSSARDADLDANDYPTPAHDARDIRVDDSDGSNVSESTRERRKRRRSPQTYTGEELPDLARNRTMTPPPDHDEIMDTALGVAAGLGFGESQGERAPRPKSPTPTKPRADEPTWSFDNVATAIPRELQEGNRDSAIQFDSPTMDSGHPRVNRDSGYVQSPATGHAWEEGGIPEDDRQYLRPARPQSPTSSTEDVSTYRQAEPSARDMFETPVKRMPSPIESTTKDRSSVVFKSSPAAPSPHTPHIDTSVGRDSPSDIRRSPGIHGHHLSREQLRSLSPSSQPRRTSDNLASNLIDRASATSVDRAVFSPPPYSHVSGPLSPPKSPLQAIPEHRQSTDFAAAAALGAAGLGAAALLSRDSTSRPTGGARSLGRSKSRTSSLRNLRGSSTSPTPYDPRDIDSRSRRAVDEAAASASGNAPAASFSSARDVQGGGVGGMADVFVCLPNIDTDSRTNANHGFQDGYGSHPHTPTSPVRPPSITKRRSMQQIQDLQARVDQLASDNRMLAEAKIVAERHLEEFHLDRNRAEYATEEALREAELKVQERDEEIEKLKVEVEVMAAQHDEQSRSMGAGTAAGLAGAAGLAAGAMAGGSWEEDKQELEDLRSQHRELSTGVDEIVRREVDSAVAEKTVEIERLQNDLTLAKQRIKELQSQILRERSQAGDSIITFRDEDYFDQKCQELCQHVQGWVLRFSKFSDSRVCRSTSDVRDEKVVDRFDNAILDGSDVDVYLGDRVKRRDVFMSVVMTMIWEYVFTRYLFGMDRDQRQKLKQLEKNLGEVGTKAQIGQWRAMTLTLLAKRDGFKSQCESDTDAVSYEILGTLSKFLPPPANLQEQILESLRNVLRLAVGVSVEMRCQSAEYIMLPPLQPEYDTNGDLVRKVFFNAGLMNERSGETKSNEELQEQGAVVRVVLFPLVVKKGGEEEGEEEEIVVCPAQVLVARVDKGKKVKRSSSGKSRVTSGRSEGAQSTHSLGAMSGVEMGSGNGNVI